MSDFEMADFLYPQSRFNFLNMVQEAGDFTYHGYARRRQSESI
jgi:hypothetical protein